MRSGMENVMGKPFETKRIILERMKIEERPLAVFEFNLHGPGLSENSIATRLSEMARAGLCVGWKRKGKAFKEWVAIGPFL